MSELKKNRIAAAVTVNVIILIVILAVAAVYTMAQVVIKAKQEKALRAEIARYKQLIAEGEKTLEDLQSDSHLLYLALLNGWVFQSDTGN